MVKDISIRFLGTSSQTNPTRNYSSLLVKMDHQTAMVDCGESTQRQLLHRHVGGEEKLSNIRTIFITHLHQDHVLGLVPLLCTMMGPSAAAASGPSAKPERPRVEIYGPSGLRALLRMTLTLCYTTLHGTYTVHELLWPSQSAYLNDAITSPEAGIVSASLPESTDPLLGALNGPPRNIPHLPPLEYEAPGMDFRLDESSASWPSIASFDGVTVSAAPILHRCPAMGYVFEEAPSASVGVTSEMLRLLDANASALAQQQGIKHPRSLLTKLTRNRQPITLPDGHVLLPPKLDIEGRKVVVLGDTSDATAGLDVPGNVRGMAALAQDADCLVHECTNTALPGVLLPGQRQTDERREEVRAKALMRGHSTPQVAGGFAARCGALQLLLNHFSIRHPAPHPLFTISDRDVEGTVPKSEQERRFMAIQEIERQATEAWHAGLSDESRPHANVAMQKRAIASYDGLHYHIPPRRPRHSAHEDVYHNGSVDVSSEDSQLNSLNSSVDSSYVAVEKGEKRGGGNSRRSAVRRGRGRGKQS